MRLFSRRTPDPIDPELTALRLDQCLDASTIGGETTTSGAPPDQTFPKYQNQSQLNNHQGTNIGLLRSDYQNTSGGLQGHSLASSAAGTPKMMAKMSGGMFQPNSKIK